jgi:hypothetical protein
MESCVVSGRWVSGQEATVNAQGPFSLRAYARHRGCHLNAVQRAIASQRLDRCIVRVDGVPKITDFAEADTEWSANTDPVKVPLAVQIRAEERQTMARRFQIVSLGDLRLVEMYYEPDASEDDEEDEASVAIGLEPAEARWLGEQLIAAARRIR